MSISDNQLSSEESISSGFNMDVIRRVAQQIANSKIPLKKKIKEIAILS